jgi:tRNA pseudouridine38-40 synthase
VVGACLAPEGFHARFGAVRKTYAYTLWTEPEFVWPQRRPFVWACGTVDPAAMEEAAFEFTGTRDFAAMQNAGTTIATTVRTIFSITRHAGTSPFETVCGSRPTVPQADGPQHDGLPRGRGQG